MRGVQFIRNGKWRIERPSWSPIAEILIQHSASENHYHTMEIEDIQSLPVGNIAADDCILFCG